MGTGSRPDDRGDRPGNVVGRVPVPIFREPARPNSLAPFRTAVDPHFGQGDELIEPEIGDDRVVIEEDEVFAAGVLQALVDRRGEPDILGVGDHRDRHARGVLHAGQVGGRIVGRAIIDDD